MVVPKGMITGLNGDLAQQMEASANRCFSTFPKTDFSAILWPSSSSLILVTPLDGLVLKKVSRELKESLLVVFGIKEWEGRLLLPKTFGGENFIQDSRMNQHGAAKHDCDLHSD